jgi:chromosome partitioning protein
MIIVFANQKGGTGKSTNCIQFANYLYLKGIPITVLDLDYQQSILKHRQKDIEIWDNEVTYEILPVELEKAVSLIGDFKQIDDGHLLIDLPGKVDDESVHEILKAADIAICPFKYDELTVTSTIFFGKLMREYLKSEIPIFFLPNNVQKRVRYDAKEQIVEALSTMGVVTKEIAQSVAMERIATLFIEDKAVELVKEAFEEIIQKGGIS